MYGKSKEKGSSLGAPLLPGKMTDDDSLNELNLTDEENHDPSIPLPKIEPKDTNSIMQTIAGVAGNVLEW